MMNNEAAEKVIGLMAQLKIRLRLKTLDDLVFMMDTNDHLTVLLFEVLRKELSSMMCDINLIAEERRKDDEQT